MTNMDVPPDIIEAARKIDNFVKMQGGSAPWVIGPVCSRDNFEQREALGCDNDRLKLRLHAAENINLGCRAMEEKCEKALRRVNELERENAKLKASYNEHLMRLAGEKNALRDALQDAYKYVLQIDSTILLPDHACAQCVPNSELIKQGYVCVYHKALATGGKE